MVITQASALSEANAWSRQMIIDEVVDEDKKVAEAMMALLLDNTRIEFVLLPIPFSHLTYPADTFEELNKTRKTSTTLQSTQYYW